MDRKEIIVNEIKYWKKSRLLPEQYCNFLLTLYTEGKETSESQKKSEGLLDQLKSISLIIIGLILFSFTFLVIYFTDFSPTLQIVLALFFSVAMFTLALLVKKFDRRLIHFFIMSGALMLFLVTIHGVNLIFPHQPTAIISSVIVTCFLWIYVGVKFRLKYFILSGIVGCLLAVYFFIK